MSVQVQHVPQPLQAGDESVRGGPFTLVERYECHTIREPALW